MPEHAADIVGRIWVDQVGGFLQFSVAAHEFAFRNQRPSQNQAGGSGGVADQERAHRPGDDIKIDASFAMGKAKNVSASRGSSPNIAMFDSGFARPGVPQGGAASHHLSYHHSLYVGSAHPPHTQGKVQSAVSLALSGIYLLQTEALIGLMERQTTSKVPAELILPIMAGFDRW
jgi:hypothetical protein